MLASQDKDVSIFTGKVRARACGLLEENDRLLLIKHDTIGTKGFLWSPPGGGIDFGESAEIALKREFLEETNLKIEILQFLFVYEMINKKHHAIELFYKVGRIGGNLNLGKDPEFDEKNQIMRKLDYFSFDEIDKMDKEVIHGIFREVKSSQKVFELRGLLSFKY